jgi:adenosylhomocysteine nucleosidase
LVAEGAQALVSFGLAGGLEPALRPGDLILPREIVEHGVVFIADAALAARFGGLTLHRLLAGDVVVPDAASKRAARALGFDAVDLESGAVARVAQEHGLPFAVVRAICDPAERDLPPAAMVGLNQKGAIALVRVLGSLFRYPGQLRDLIALGGDVTRARKTLLRAVDRFSRLT